MNKERKEKLQLQIKRAHIRAGSAENNIDFTFYLGKLSGIRSTLNTEIEDADTKELKEHIVYTIDWLEENRRTEQGKRYYKTMKEEMIKKKEW